MNYEQIIRETDEMIRRMTLKWDIISAILIALMAALVIIGIRLIWEEHRDRREKSFPVTAYQPTVTDIIQVMDGVEYHKMGTPKEV